MVNYKLNILLPKVSIIQIILKLEMGERKAWTAQEDQALRSFVKKYGIKRWDTISDEMKERFLDENGRTPNQCKERWMNCLCPKISKDNWTREELKYVFTLHMEEGNKWSDISQKLKSDFGKVRTDCAIKNQFYSALRRGLRRICKVLQIKNGTEKINKIRPNTLTNLLQGSANLEKKLIYDLIFDCSDNDKFEDIRKKIHEASFKQIVDQILVKVFGKEGYQKLLEGESEILISETNQVNEECPQAAILPGKVLETSFEIQQEMVEVEQMHPRDKKSIVQKIEDEESIKLFFNSKNINGFIFESGGSSSGGAKILFDESWKYQKYCDPEMIENFRNLSTSLVSSKTASQNQPLVSQIQKMNIA